LVFEMSEFWDASRFDELVRKKISIVDVRSEGEFEQGHVPHSVNSPILRDEERAKVGLTYKTEGPEAAIRLGHELVSGQTKQARIDDWIRRLSVSENSVITCYRGGMRSALAQSWCREAGVHRPRVRGGYKALRHFLTEQMERRTPDLELTVVSGATGSGKTLLLRDLAGRRCLDLEAMAHHRGSAFGAWTVAQPAPAVFENRLAFQMTAFELERPSREDRLLVEDESRLIGLCVQPESFFLRLRASPIVLIEESLAARAEITFDDYIRRTALNGGEEDEGLRLFDRYLESLRKISRRLGGLRTSEVEKDLLAARDAYLTSRDLEPNRVWIRKLLEWYYDPMYHSSLEKRSPRLLFRGDRREVFEFLSARLDQKAL
jgi:tRNA 2-selenouridine synthase